MPNRKLNAGSYRYGFNGQEMDNEVAGQGNINTAEFWEYDVRTARRWNVDPKPFAGISNYACFAGNPILLNDIHGDTPGEGGGDKTQEGGVCDEDCDGDDKQQRKETRRANNTPVGQWSLTYNPMKYTQIGGNVLWKQQNDLAYVNPFAPNYDRFAPDETSGIWELGPTIGTRSFGSTFRLNVTVGLSLSRIKGGILTPGQGDYQQPHFGHGLGDLGGFNKIEGQLKLAKGINLTASLGTAAGITFSGFDNETEKYSQGFIKLGWLDTSEPSWSSRGFGATGYTNINLTIGSSVFKKSSKSDIFKITLGFTAAVHANYIAPYSNHTTGQDYGTSTIITGGTGVRVGITYDVKWGE